MALYVRLARMHVTSKEAIRYASSESYKKRNRKFRKMQSIKEGILENEVLFGRSVCNIALKISRRPAFKLHLLKLWENTDPTDTRLVETISMAEDRKIPLSYLTRSKLDALSLYRPHQGVCLEVGELPYRKMDEDICLYILQEIQSDEHPQLWVLLCGVLDPMNMGAILRSCLYFGVERIVVTRDCAPLTPIVSKSSSGASEILQVFNANNPESIVKVLLEKGWEVIGTVADPIDTKNDGRTVEDISAIKTDQHTLIVFGSEGSGIPHDLLELCSVLVTITPPVTSCTDQIRSLAGSLNVSTATAIVLHSLRMKKS